jgi:hypothetical protein
MTSEQIDEFVRRDTGAGQDAAQRAPGYVPTRVYGHGNRSPVRMVHDVVTTVDARDGETSSLESPDNLRSRYGRDAARHKPANYQRLGNVECQRHLVWYPHFFDEKFQPGTQVGKRLIPSLSVAKRGHARTKLGRGAPNAVLVLLNDVGHVYYTCHDTSITRTRQQGTPGDTRRHQVSGVIHGPIACSLCPCKLAIPHGTSRDVLS